MLIDQSFVFTTVRYTIAVLYELLYVTIESGLYHDLFPDPLHFHRQSLTVYSLSG